MTTATRLLRAFFILSMVLLWSVTALGQDKSLLPAGLNQQSSVKEILTWLGQTSFPNARILLKDSWDDFTYRSQLEDSPPAKNTFIFTQGFRVSNIDGCNLLLRNDDARKVTKSKLEDSTYRLIAEVWVQLDRMSATKGRHTYRYTKDPEKVKLLGAWRTEFTYKGWSSNTMVGLTLSSPEWKETQKWTGMKLAFTFDTEEMGKNFDAAFRQAIRLCK